MPRANSVRALVMTKGPPPVLFERVPEARRPPRAAATTEPRPAAPAQTKPANAFDVELCATSPGPGPTWTRRLVFDGTGHLAVGEELAPRRRDDPAASRRFWAQDVGHYEVKGHRVSLRLGDGQQTCLAGGRDAAGRVSALLCGGWLYEAATCQARPPAR